MTNGNTPEQISVFCDESCHLEFDHQTAMTLGCIWVPKNKIFTYRDELKALKLKYCYRRELKWAFVSPGLLQFYLDVVDWFFESPDLHFRALVVSHKDKLKHEVFNAGSHDDFYYKSYFSLLSKVLSPDKRYSIYLDIKDTCSNQKLAKLTDVLCNDKYDFTHSMIAQLRHVRSHEVAMCQIADFLIGAVSYKNRGLTGSASKLAVIARIEQHTGRSLTSITSLFESKFNIFIWSPKVER